MKYLLFACGALVLGLAFISFFRLSLSKPRFPVTGKYFSRLTALAVALLCACFFWMFDGATTLTAQMSSVGDTATLFYFGESDDAVAYSQSLNEKGEVRFTLPKGVNLRLIRFDPVEGEGDFTLTGMQLRIFGVQLESFTPEQIFNGLATGNIPVMELTDGGIHFVTQDNDPITIMPEGVTATVNSYLRVYTILTMAGSVILGLLLGWIFSGGCILAFFDRCAVSLRACFEKYRIRPAPIIVAIVHFLFCFYIQHTNFPFEARLANKIIVYECVFFVLLQTLWQLIFHVAENVRNRDQATLDHLKFSGIYFCAMFIFHLLIWPGYYVTDEYVMLWRSTQWDLLADYHFIVQDSMVLMQMLIPGAAGVELGFNLMDSYVVGYVFREIYNRCGRTKWIYLLYIPMVFPAVLLNNYQWQKSPFGTYLEILLLCKVTCAILDNRKLTKKDVIEWSLLTAVTFTLRMDGVYYIVAAPVILLLIFRKKASRPLLAALAAGIVLFSGLFQTIQNSGPTGSRYKVVNFSRLAYAPLIAADPVKDSKELETLNKYFDVDAYISAGNVDAATGVVPLDEPVLSTDEAVSEFTGSIARLIIKHPIAYLAQQTERFLLSSGFKPFMEEGPLLYDMVIENYQDPDTANWDPKLGLTPYVDDIDANPLNKPINQTLRLRVIRFCMGRDIDAFHIDTIRDFLFNNLIPSALFLLIAWLYLLRKKKFSLFGVMTLFILRFPLLFASSSYVCFQYYLRFFVVGNAIPFYLLVRFLSARDAAKRGTPAEIPDNGPGANSPA